MVFPGRRFLPVFLLIVLLALGVVVYEGFSLFAESQGAREPAAGTVHLSGSEPETLDPAFAQDSSSSSYLSHIHAGLVRLDKSLEVVPDLASGWQLSPDRRTYTFTLREDAFFHDGRQITAADVKYSLERAADPELRSPVVATYLGDIVGLKERLAGRANEVAGVSVVDERTVAITVDAPKVYFLAKLTYPVASVLDRANVESGREWYKKPNGAGLYRLASWDDDWIVLHRFGRHHSQAEAPYEVRFYLGNRSHMAMYEMGELDAIGVGLGDVERVLDPNNALNRELVVGPAITVNYLALNVGMEPFDDRAVRRAFAQAIDKQKIVDVTLKGTVRKAEGILPPGLDAYDPDFVGLPYDLESAQRSLAQSSYGSSAGLPPVTVTGGLGETFAQIFYRNLGAEIEVEAVREGYYQGLSARAYQMFFAGWVADYPDPENFLDTLLHSQSAANHTGYSNPQVDRLLETARVEADPDRRISLYRQVERIAVEDAALIPLFFDVNYHLVKPRVTGLEYTPLGLLTFEGVAVR